jgi:hypothetical protein
VSFVTCKKFLAGNVFCSEATHADLVNLSFSVLLRNKILETLNISACGLTAEGGTTISEVLSSGCVELESLSLDISNNNFGPTGTDNRKFSNKNGSMKERNLKEKFSGNS